MESSSRVSLPRTAFAVLVPGPAGTGCYLWRATTQPVSGRGAALALPVAIVLLVLADRLSADRFRLRRQVRSVGTAAIGLVTVAAWTGFAAQGRPSCTTSPAVIGTIACGTLATAVAAHWATRSTRPLDRARRRVRGRCPPSRSISPNCGQSLSNSWPRSTRGRLFASGCSPSRPARSPYCWCSRRSCRGGSCSIRSHSGRPLPKPV